MAIPLTNIQEPGFFSEIEVSPSLFLTPGSIQVVALIGTGLPTKTITENDTRGSDSYDVLSSPISSINLTSSTSVYRFPQSSYSVAEAGSVDLTTLTYPTDLNALTFTVHVDGHSAETVTFSSPANPAAVIAQINTAMTNVKAVLTATNKLLVYVNPLSVALAGLSFTAGALSDTADTVLGFIPATRANALWWNPAVTDPEFAPQAGQIYQTNYQTPKVAADFAPQSFFTLSQVVATYGDAADSSGNVVSSLSLGAQGAFGNGASVITCRQLNPANLSTQAAYTSEINNALSDLENQTVSLLVPMIPLNSALTLDMTGFYLNHVSKMSSLLERQERMALLAMDETDGRLNILGSAPSWQSFSTELQPSLSSGLQSKRIMLMNPGYAQTTYKGVSVTTDGTYNAACLAGEMVNADNDVATPMTFKDLSTITALLLPDLLRSEKNTLTSLGVTVLQPTGTIIQVRRAVTMDNSSIANVEPSIVRSFDYVAQQLRAGLENRFIGQKILGTTHTAIEAATTSFLEQLVAQEIISTYRNVKAVQDKTEPRQFDVSFEAVPIFPFIWGFLDISITLS